VILTVASGKGGTGKTLVATSLALSLKDKSTIQLIDCDVEEPNAHVFLKPVFTERESVCVPVPSVDEEMLVFPELCHGCGACSYLCPEDAITEVGKEVGVVETGHADGIQFAHGKLNVGEAMAPPVIRRVKEYINHEGTVIIDVSPGTSCPVVESIRGSDYCILVTEPTPFGLNDLILAVEVLRKLDIPCGVVLNRTGVGDNKVEKYCQKEEIPILLTIPLDTRIAGYYSRGISLVEGIPQWRGRFLDLYNKVKNMAGSRVGQ